MSDKIVVLTENAPAPAHVFSQGVQKGGIFQISGQGPMDPASGEYIGRDDVRTQTKQTLENIKAILEAGGSSVEDVLMFRVYLTSRDEFSAMNEAYGAFIQENVREGKLPCRTTVFVDLPHDIMLVEIDALAVSSPSFNTAH
jgi:2-iminobutanoate/2-iminopropanoate deaminase